MKIVIDRSKWRTGGTGKHATGLGGIRLRNDEGYQCCLGFICRQYGVPEEGLDHLMPGGLSTHHQRLVAPLLMRQVKDDPEDFEQTALSNEAVDINDDLDLSREEREA